MTINTPEITPDDLRYVGFWPRFGASLIDGLILTAITGPVLTFNYGWSYWIDGAIIMGPLDFLLSYLFPAVATIWFWVAKHATPGKMVVRAKIVDARTGMAPSTGQYVGRYFAYIISVLPLFIGFLWVALDARRQGWHDKLAGTVVVAPKEVKQESVIFEDD